jgi:membrane protein
VPIRLVLLDIDGTLVDSNEHHANAWAFAFREAGKPQELDDIRREIGKGGDLLVPALAPEMDEAARKAVSERHGDRYKDLYLEVVRPFDRATDLIRHLHDSGYKVMLASSASGAELDHYVELLGVGDLLYATTTADDVETSKPAPDIFGVALERGGSPAEEAIVVGDTIYDIEAAAQAGIAAIGLTSGTFDETALREAGAVAVFRDVADLLANIDHSPLRSEG